MPVTIDAEERLAIHELIALHGGPVKRRLQTRTAHERERGTAREAASADRSRAADRNRAAVHAELAADERGWARVWAERGTATPAKTDADRTRAAAGITPTAGDTYDPAALTAAAAGAGELGWPGPVSAVRCEWEDLGWVPRVSTHVAWGAQLCSGPGSPVGGEALGAVQGSRRWSVSPAVRFVVRAE